MGIYTSIIGAIATSGVWFDNYIPYQVFDISCTGTEDKLLDCQYSTTSSSSCGRLSHASVFCQRGNYSHRKYNVFMFTKAYPLLLYILATFSNPANCPDGEMRLFGGSSPLEGRVEICANRAWGTVCGNSLWRFREANVVCRQLGHSAFGKDRREGKSTLNF